MDCEHQKLADDMLEGAGAIADYIWGDKRKRRTVYWLAENKALPIFRIGLTLCCRKSTLTKWIKDQEQLALPPAAA